ncbi:hypothetical protein A8M32_01000 [Sinorhizobium alkalisoli]|uniref:Uncharacterized protein n=1 Tax=Sinorhizobium alkalisoli TaxID=1752398 RepID=A0A1E3VHW8_9HYPH|nr:hypothetical protein A8M32_01000 [Sinorhizobium alkalisoli]
MEAPLLSFENCSAFTQLSKVHQRMATLETKRLRKRWPPGCIQRVPARQAPTANIGRYERIGEKSQQLNIPKMIGCRCRNRGSFLRSFHMRGRRRRGSTGNRAFLGDKRATPPASETFVVHAESCAAIVSPLIKLVADLLEQEHPP